jgi:hypothetical protein
MEETIDLELYAFLFHYNSYTKSWGCFNRADYRNYWNGTESIHKIGRGATLEAALKDAQNDKDKG